MCSAIIWMCLPKKERAAILFLQLFLSLNDYEMLKCLSSEEVKWTGLLFSWISFFWWFPNRKLLSTFYDRSHPSWQDSILKQMRRDKKGKYSCQEFLDIKWKYSQQSNRELLSTYYILGKNRENILDNGAPWIFAESTISAEVWSGDSRKIYWEKRLKEYLHNRTFLAGKLIFWIKKWYFSYTFYQLDFRRHRPTKPRLDRREMTILRDFQFFYLFKKMSSSHLTRPQK